MASTRPQPGQLNTLLVRGLPAEVLGDPIPYVHYLMFALRHWGSAVRSEMEFNRTYDIGPDLKVRKNVVVGRIRIKVAEQTRLLDWYNLNNIEELLSQPNIFERIHMDIRNATNDASTETATLHVDYKMLASMDPVPAAVLATAGGVPTPPFAPTTPNPMAAVQDRPAGTPPSPPPPPFDPALLDQAVALIEPIVRKDHPHIPRSTLELLVYQIANAARRGVKALDALAYTIDPKATIEQATHYVKLNFAAPADAEQPLEGTSPEGTVLKANRKSDETLMALNIRDAIYQLDFPIGENGMKSARATAQIKGRSLRRIHLNSGTHSATLGADNVSGEARMVDPNRPTIPQFANQEEQVAYVIGLMKPFYPETINWDAISAKHQEYLAYKLRTLIGDNVSKVLPKTFPIFQFVGAGIEVIDLPSIKWEPHSHPDHLTFLKTAHAALKEFKNSSPEHWEDFERAQETARAPLEPPVIDEPKRDAPDVQANDGTRELIEIPDFLRRGPHIDLAAATPAVPAPVPVATEPATPDEAADQQALGVMASIADIAEAARYSPDPAGALLDGFDELIAVEAWKQIIPYVQAYDADHPDLPESILKQRARSCLEAIEEASFAAKYISDVDPDAPINCPPLAYSLNTRAEGDLINLNRFLPRLHLNPLLADDKAFIELLTKNRDVVGNEEVYERADRKFAEQLGAVLEADARAQLDADGEIADANIINPPIVPEFITLNAPNRAQPEAPSALKANLAAVGYAAMSVTAVGVAGGMSVLRFAFKTASKSVNAVGGAIKNTGHQFKVAFGNETRNTADGAAARAALRDKLIDAGVSAGSGLAAKALLASTALTPVGLVMGAAALGGIAATAIKSTVLNKDFRAACRDGDWRDAGWIAMQDIKGQGVALFFRVATAGLTAGLAPMVSDSVHHYIQELGLSDKFNKAVKAWRDWKPFASKPMPVTAPPAPKPDPIALAKAQAEQVWADEQKRIGGVSQAQDAALARLQEEADERARQEVQQRAAEKAAQRAAENARIEKLTTELNKQGLNRVTGDVNTGAGNNTGYYDRATGKPLSQEQVDKLNQWAKEGNKPAPLPGDTESKATPPKPVRVAVASPDVGSDTIDLQQVANNFRAPEGESEIDLRQVVAAFAPR